MKQWSKLQKKVHNLVDSKLDFNFRCSVYEFKTKHSNYHVPRFIILLNKEIIWETPCGYSCEWWNIVPEISNIISDYIDSPKTELLNKIFEKDVLKITDILKSADRRFGKKSLLKLREKIKTPGAIKIVEVRLNSLSKKKACKKTGFAQC